MSKILFRWRAHNNEIYINVLRNVHSYLIMRSQTYNLVVADAYRHKTSTECIVDNSTTCTPIFLLLFIIMIFYDRLHTVNVFYNRHNI